MYVLYGSTGGIVYRIGISTRDWGGLGWCIYQITVDSRNSLVRRRGPASSALFAPARTIQPRYGQMMSDLERLETVMNHCKNPLGS